MTIRVFPVEATSRKHKIQFVNFPFKLYRNCPQWVPPLRASVFDALDPDRNEAIRAGEAAFYLAEKKGAISGRIGVLENVRENQYNEEKKASFCFFDCIDDPAVSQALFDQVFDWAEIKGLTEMIGPRGLTNLNGSGVLVKGFEHRSALNMPYNFSYYDGLVQGAGFEKTSDSFSGYLNGDYKLPQRVEEIAAKVKIRRGLWIKSFTNKDEMRQWIPKVAIAYLRAFNTRPDYAPFSEAEMISQGNMLVDIADPRLIKLVMHDEEVVGFIFAYHDIGPALQKSGGRLWPLGWLYIIREQKRNNWININGIGLVPEHQRVGGDALLFTELAKSVKSLGFKHADIVMVDELNAASRNDMEALGVVWYKANRNYARKL